MLKSRLRSSKEDALTEELTEEEALPTKEEITEENIDGDLDETVVENNLEDNSPNNIDGKGIGSYGFTSSKGSNAASHTTRRIPAASVSIGAIPSNAR